MVIGLFQCKLLNHSHAVCVNINILEKPGLTFVLGFFFFVYLLSSSKVSSNMGPVNNIE